VGATPIKPGKTGTGCGEVKRISHPVSCHRNSIYFVPRLPASRTAHFDRYEIHVNSGTRHKFSELWK